MGSLVEFSSCLPSFRCSLIAIGFTNVSIFGWSSVGQHFLKVPIERRWNMNTCFKRGLVLAVITSLSAISVNSAMAQSYLDGSAKARGDYGQMSRSSVSPMYRATAPIQERSFSYEPAPSAAQPSQTTDGCGCGNSDSGKTAATKSTDRSARQCRSKRHEK